MQPTQPVPITWEQANIIPAGWEELPSNIQIYQPGSGKTLSFESVTLAERIRETKGSIASEYDGHLQNESIRSIIEVVAIQFLVIAATATGFAFALHLLTGLPLGAAFGVGSGPAFGVVAATVALHTSIRLRTMGDNEKRNLAKMRSFGDRLTQGNKVALEELRRFLKRTGMRPGAHPTLSENEKIYVAGAALLEFVREREGLGKQSPAREVCPSLPPRQDVAPSAPPLP